MSGTFESLGMKESEIPQPWTAVFPRNAHKATTDVKQSCNYQG